jgi:hypothetical protein
MARTQCALRAAVRTRTCVVRIRSGTLGGAERLIHLKLVHCGDTHTPMSVEQAPLCSAPLTDALPRRHRLGRRLTVGPALRRAQLTD